MGEHRPDDVSSGGAMVGGELVWRDDVRLGWLVTDGPAQDAFFWAVRSDGKTVASPDRPTLMAAMVTADVTRTWREAWGWPR